MAAIWSKENITLPDGKTHPAAAPLILSASRATDIPAFYADWLFERLDAGWLNWKNPFSGLVQTIALHKVRAIVFWSKYPAPIISKLDWLDKRGITYYFQYTLNDYTGTGLEPDLPAIGKRIACFRTLSERLGPERVIWRFDPLLLGRELHMEFLLERIARIAEQLSGYTQKLVFSFADLKAYRKVSSRLAADNPQGWREFEENEMRWMALKLGSRAPEWRMEAASCAENIGLEEHGISHNACIDGALLADIGARNEHLRTFLASRAGNRKDPGQRPDCRCIAAKDIGQYGSCGYSCRYCYAG